MQTHSLQPDAELGEVRRWAPRQHPPPRPRPGVQRSNTAARGGYRALQEWLVRLQNCVPRK